MGKANTISPSQLDAMGCRFSWFLGYRKGYRAKRSSPALEFGTGIHEALEKYYGKKENPIEAFDRWLAARVKKLAKTHPDAATDLHDMGDLGRGMLEGYLIEYPKDDFEVLATEKFITRLITPPEGCEPIDCSISVRLDGLVRDNHTKALFSLEHKTFSQFSPNFLDLDHQMTAQVFVTQAAAKEMGIEGEVMGVIYNGLRKQLPSPRVRNRLFERTKVYRNQRQIDIFLHRAYWQFRETQAEDLPIYPQPNLVRCSQCDFQAICRAYMLGEDWQYLLDETYERRA